MHHQQLSLKTTLVQKENRLLDFLILSFYNEIYQIYFETHFLNFTTILGSLPKCGERETVASFRHLVVVLLLLCVGTIFL